MKKTYRRHSEEFKQEVIDHMRNTTNFSLQEMCHAFNISRSGYRHHSSDKINQLKAWRIKPPGTLRKYSCRHHLHPHQRRLALSLCRYRPLLQSSSRLPNQWSNACEYRHRSSVKSYQPVVDTSWIIHISF